MRVRFDAYASSGIVIVSLGSHMERAVKSVMILVVLAGSAGTSASFSSKTSPVTALIRHASSPDQKHASVLSWPAHMAATPAM